MTSHARAALVDTTLAALWEQTGELEAGVASRFDSVHRAIGERRDPWARRQDWPTTDAIAEAELRRRLDAGEWLFEVEPGRSILAYPGTQHAKDLAYIDEARSRIATLAAEARPLQDEYGRDAWSRFFLVLNSGGHVHSSRNCQTTFPTTRWAWLPSLSGLTEADAVAEQGPRLCSVCFPSAPIEWTLGLPKTPRCPGSGQTGQRIGRSSCGSCPSCGKSYAMGESGAIRAHKPA